MSRRIPAERAPTEVLGIALDWLNGGRRVAVATVVETCGSSPRPVGSNLVVADDGTFEGSVSGGCVEGAVVCAAQDVIESGSPAALVTQVDGATPAHGQPSHRAS